MKLSTEQIRALMRAKPAVIPLASLCEAAGVHYGNLYMRLYRGSNATDAEGEALGSALVAALPAGWIGDVVTLPCATIGRQQTVTNHKGGPITVAGVTISQGQSVTFKAKDGGGWKVIEGTEASDET